MNFAQKLDGAVAKNNSLLCVNLDPTSPDLFEFNKKIIDATYDLVCCYKPNSAFYEAHGANGIEQLKQTIAYIHEKDSDLPIILDAKRGDIGNTNAGYATYAFEYLGADAITVQPYMGGESLVSFFEHTDKGVFVLCRTSNPGAGELQDLLTSSVILSESADESKDLIPLYQFVATQAVSWNKNNNVMLVIGATYPDELKQVRQIVGDMTILVPGIGAQGGDLQSSLQAGLTPDKKGLIISVGRSIINAADVRGEAEKMRDEINKFRQ